MPVISWLLFLWFPPSLWNHTVGGFHIHSCGSIPSTNHTSTKRRRCFHLMPLLMQQEWIRRMSKIGIKWCGSPCKHWHEPRQNTIKHKSINSSYSVWMSCSSFFSLSILEIISVCSPSTHAHQQHLFCGSSQSECLCRAPWRSVHRPRSSPALGLQTAPAAAGCTWRRRTFNLQHAHC